MTNKPLEERNTKIVALYEAGLSLRQIGVEYNLSAEAVRKVLKKHGVVLRKSGWTGAKEYWRRRG